VRAPENAAEGRAKVTYRFDAWQDVAVASSTFELPVVEPPVRAPRPVPQR
jgi:hypothetical protein